MSKFVFPLLLLCFAAACGNSMTNPFSADTDEEQNRMQVLERQIAAEGRELVAHVSAVRADINPDGVILIATGLPESQGYWDARLVSLNDEVPEDGMLSYEFVVSEPAESIGIGSPESREIVVGRYISNRKLKGVSRIRVVSASNVRSLGF